MIQPQATIHVKSMPVSKMSDVFRRFVLKAFHEDVLWIMSIDYDTKYEECTQRKYRREFDWFNPTGRFSEQQIINNLDNWCFGFSHFWLLNQREKLFFLRNRMLQDAYETSWHDIFVMLRTAGIESSMLYNNLNHLKIGTPGHGLVFISEVDAVLAQALIEQAYSYETVRPWR